MQVQDLILNMSNESMSMKSMMQVCGLKSRMTFRENYVAPALLDNAIERKYPNEPNHPRQMYQLTKQALEWKKSQED
ncbi:Fic family protein [Prevotella lacticifex]